MDRLQWILVTMIVVLVGFAIAALFRRWIPPWVF
jgi:hypothetical protein